MKKLFGTCFILGVFILAMQLISSQFLRLSGTAYAWPEDGKKCAQCHSSMKASSKSVKFGPTKVDVAITREIILTNNGNDDLIIDTPNITFTGASSTEFSQTNNCDGSILYLSNCTISVTAIPTNFGKRLAGLSIPSNDWKAPEVIIPLSVDVKPPKIKTKSSVSFSTTPGVPSPNALVISNKGLSDLIISNTLTPTGIDAAEFSMTTDSCSPIPQGQSCSLEVTYAPAVAKTSEAQIVIESNDQVKSSVTVKLKGKSK